MLAKQETENHRLQRTFKEMSKQNVVTAIQGGKRWWDFTIAIGDLQAVTKTKYPEKVLFWSELKCSFVFIMIADIKIWP